MKKEVMKRPYISPSAKTVAYCPFHFCQKSNPDPNSTGWYTGDDNQGNDKPIGGGQPNPNEDSRYLRQGMWDDYE